jgi:hypothetical protein
MTLTLPLPLIKQTIVNHWSGYIRIVALLFPRINPWAKKALNPCHSERSEESIQQRLEQQRVRASEKFISIGKNNQSSNRRERREIPLLVEIKRN